MASSYRRVLLLCSLSLGCPRDPDPQPEGGSTTELGSTQAGPATSAASTTTGAVDTTAGAPACHDELYECFASDYEPLECGAAPACDTLRASEPFDVNEVAFENPEAASCILDGLGSAMVGVYTVSVQYQRNVISDYRFEVLSDGAVIARVEEAVDKGCDGSDRRLQLRPTAHFEGCAAEATDELVLECLVDLGTELSCTDGAPLCPG